MFKMENIKKYQDFLLEEEKSEATIEKYMRDIKAFAIFAEGRTLCKTLVLEYKSVIMEKYSLRSVNSMLSSLNRYFDFCERYDLKVKHIKIQRQIFLSKEKELTKAEYERLLETAKNKKNERLYLLMQTICACGIRVSELKFITAEAVFCGFAEISCKGKRRTVFLPNQLCKILKNYIKKQKIKSGSVFITKNGTPLDRSNIWSDMKKLCCMANVSEKKVFPHNLRHLFARTHYSLQKDIVRLADILGHTNVNTTRIYTMESGEIHRRQMQRLGLLFTT
ncbi:MAG: tyrosine-type recombinase/integrase [Clostridia bacterium]|nr:tyrosine-type recombinase/integrase [Clostridia bacterium]